MGSRSRITIWEEHRATQLCAGVLYDMKDELEVRAERQRPTAVGAAPEGDPYVLASLLAQMVLLDAGWAATNLGPNTPLASLTEAMRELRPRTGLAVRLSFGKPGRFSSGVPSVLPGG